MGGCTYDVGDSILDELVQQFGEQQLLPWAKMLQYEDPDPAVRRLRQLLHSVRTHIKNFKVELRFLLIFLDYIRKWTSASRSVQNLAILAVDIEAVVHDSVELLSNFASRVNTPNEWSTKLITVMSSSWKRNDFKKKDLEERSWKLTHILLDFMGRIGSLKKTIKWTFLFLSADVFHDHLSPLDEYILWDKFVGAVFHSFQSIRLKSEVSDSLRDQIRAFEDRLSGLRFYLDQIYNSNGCFPHDLRMVDFMNHVGGVAIRAAQVSVWCWCEDEDLDEDLDGAIDVHFIGNSDNGKEIDNVQQEIEIARDVSVFFSNMNQDIDLSTLVFLELNLGVLEAFHHYTGTAFMPGTSLSRAYLFVEYLFDKTVETDLLQDLESLVTFYIYNLEASSEIVRCRLAKIKDILREAALLKYIPFKGSKTRLVSSQLLGKMWLTQVEILLEKQLSSRNSVLNVKGQIEEFEGRVGLLKLKTSSDDPQEGCEETDDGKETFVLIKKVANQVASLNSSSCDHEITGNVFVLSNLLLQIALFKAKSYLLELLNSNANFIEIFKDRFVTIHNGLKFLSLLVANHPEENTNDRELVFTLAEEVAREVILLYHFHPINEMTEKTNLEFAVLLRTLMNKIKLIKAKLDETYLPFPKSGFPKINGLGFINLLVQNTKELLDLEDESIAHVKDNVQEILGCLEFLKPFTSIIEEQNTERQIFKDLGAQIMNVAYQTEYVIDSIYIGCGPQWQTLSWLYEISEEIRYIKHQTSIVTSQNGYAAGAQNHAQICKVNASPSNNPEIDDVVVCLRDQEEILVDRLTRGSKQRGIVSLVGMPGIGKTTLAKMLYKNPKVMYHFHVLAWCSVTQVHKKRELLLGILSHIGSLTDNLLEMADEDLDMELYRCLKQKRYLIVMDDMWNIAAWNDLERSFPNDGNGSRILITSRIRDLLVEAKLDNDPHHLRLLSFDESWALLQMMIFHAEHCAEELVEVGKQIAENCKGLPLAVVAIAGLLKRTDKNHKWWRSIADSLSSSIIDDPRSRCMDILELSYLHLPNHLKACFLYFGAFLGDKDIQVYKLLLLWIAEGFVVETESKSCEDLAEEHLMDLVGRSLIKVAKRSSTGRVKTCRIHDLLRDLCIIKAKEENFLRLITSSDESYASFDGLDYGVDFEHCGTSSCKTYEDYRLCIRSKRRHFFMSTPSGQRVRSLLFFAANDMYPRCPYDISCIYGNFKLLKVLDLECINLGVSFPSGLESLVLLRYLAVSGDIDSLPSSVSELLDLEIFVVKGLKGKVVFPDSIWYMASLRHIRVNSHAIFSLPDDENADFFGLDNLVTLSSLSLSHREDAGKIISRLPNLRKLRFIFSDSREYYRTSYPFPSLGILTKLESLNICYYGRTFNHSAFCFPVNLKKLTLSNFCLPWNHVSIIGSLQNLEVLKLLSRACDGETWEMTEGEFPKLRYLKLDTLNIKNWIASNDHLPNLEHLVLRKCSQLDEVPLSFSEIPTLQMIKVQWCGQSTEESVRRIEEEGIEGLKVLINFPDLNFGPTS